MSESAPVISSLEGSLSCRSRSRDFSPDPAQAVPAEKKPAALALTGAQARV